MRYCPYQPKTLLALIRQFSNIGDLPQEQESGFLAQHIPQQHRVYKIYSDATHFSFMPLCKAGAIELIEEEKLGDGIVCKDGREYSRTTLHDFFFNDILTFIQSH
ncbi:hypothetical protein OAH87_01950 [Marinomonas sp.]|nr:hypothetical protein [Marinomonas sp.]MDB4837210.1 hypothetical protein [Marinomonas sp.]